jgi:hypothetical protein
MPAPIVIELTPQARAVILKLQKFPQNVGQAIKRGMDEAGQTAWREISDTRFGGIGPRPYPVAEHKLRQISGRLKLSLFWRQARVETTGQLVSVTGAMVSEGVRYFPIHEYGFSGTANVKPFFRKNRSAGKPVSQVKGHTRRMNIPARAPMHTGLQDHMINFRTKIQEELEAELAKK